MTYQEESKKLGDFFLHEIPDCIQEGTPADNAIRYIKELRSAIDFTQQYVGNDLLPPIEGWDWYDALYPQGANYVGKYRGMPRD